ncbi:MAG: NADH-quinone oxidoreductase subunit L [Bacteroidota bacterium]
MQDLINAIPVVAIYVILIPLMPLIGFLVIGLSGKYLKKEALIGGIASSMIGLSFIFSVIVFWDLVVNPYRTQYVVSLYEWISAGHFSINISYQIDRLSILFSLIITGVGFLIHVYSIGYMKGDRSFYRFFAYMNLFIFMMLNLVLSSNYLFTFLGWEGVGLCSYLLIGFWYDRKFEGVKIKWTGDAGNKAFIVNRIGDFGFIIAMFLIYITFNSLEYQSVMTSAVGAKSALFGSGIITAITLLMFLGCTGKSAQIPLAVWLPDAMAGPTPVSALIHAATMVTAGIYLVARNSVLFAMSPVSMEVVAIVGIATAFLAATIGLVQNDIKKVLAYSTVSQLGYMFAALGVGAFSAGVFHVMTHAFFKGLLFLGAGSIIHGMHEQQDIKYMGGLKKYMPITYKTFFVATLAISGIPFFSGFFSKDEILWNLFSKAGTGIWLIGAMAAFFTAFYMWRLLKLVFHGQERFDAHHVHPHESPSTMTIPLIILAVLSAVGGFLGIPYALGFWFSAHPNLMEGWLAPVFEQAEVVMAQHPAEGVHAIEYVLMAVSIGIALSAIFLAKKLYSDAVLAKPKELAGKFSSIYKLLWNKYYLDNIYFASIVTPVYEMSRKFLWKLTDITIIDGFVNGLTDTISDLSSFIRRLQSGIAQNYAMLMLFGIIAIIGFLILHF